VTHWGKAGERLTTEQAIRRARAHYPQPTEAVRAATEADGRRLWAGGQLRPGRITDALDYRNLFGPEVDEACGVEEPTVDHWELGIVYPTWQQVLALSKLTGFGPAYFALGSDPIPASSTSMRYHFPAAEIAATDAAVMRQFLPEAIAATLRAEGVIP